MASQLVKGFEYMHKRYAPSHACSCQGSGENSEDECQNELENQKPQCQILEKPKLERDGGRFVQVKL